MAMFAAMFSVISIRYIQTSCPVHGSRTKKVHRGMAALRLLNRLNKTPVDDAKYEDPNYFNKKAASLPLDENYLDEMTKLYTKKLEINKDLQFKTDDKFVSEHNNTYRLPNIEPLDAKVELWHVPALKNAPDSVKKIFSVEYGDRNDRYKFLEEQLLNRVRRNQMDRNSLPAKIAILTSAIRQITRELDIAWTTNKRRPKWMKQTIMEKIEERRKLLLKMKNTNAEGFERVLDALEINYEERPWAGDLPEGEENPESLKPRTGPYSYIQPHYIHALRHKWIEHHLRQRVEHIKEEKLRKYSIELFGRQEEFFARKQEREPQIRQQIQQLKMEIDEIKAQIDPPLQVDGVYSSSTVDSKSETGMHSYYFRDIAKYKDHFQ